jgi:hypothetical protein
MAWLTDMMSSRLFGWDLARGCKSCQRTEGLNESSICLTARASDESPPVVQITGDLFIPLKVLAAHRVYAPISAHPSQSPTSRPLGRRTTCRTQSSESQVGPQTLAFSVWV